jgi:hypothetical protein
MHSAASETGHSNVRDRTYRSVVADLMSLIEQVQAAIHQVEQAMAREESPVDAQDDVIVLDDVTPGYVMADTALNACSAKLGAALRILVN